MYHIDRNNSLNLKINDQLTIKRGEPNNTLKFLLQNKVGLIDSDYLTTVLTSSTMDQSFPIRKVFNNWDLEKYDLKHRKFLHKYRIELVYEYVRLKDCCSKISRFEGFYLTNDPDSWIVHLRAKSGANLYKFESVDAIFEEYDANWPELSMQILDFDEIYNYATNYWQAMMTEVFRSEILCVGTLQVIEKYNISIT